MPSKVMFPRPFPISVMLGDVVVTQLDIGRTCYTSHVTEHVTQNNMSALIILWIEGSSLVLRFLWQVILFVTKYVHRCPCSTHPTHLLLKISTGSRLKGLWLTVRAWDIKRWGVGGRLQLQLTNGWEREAERRLGRGPFGTLPLLLVLVGEQPPSPSCHIREPHWEGGEGPQWGSLPGSAPIDQCSGEGRPWSTQLIPTLQGQSCYTEEGKMAKS